ncbi:MAG TPA: biotin/lipoyl-containing protein, partial [Chloroflexota bacterium]
MTNTVVKMPQLGESVAEGTIGRWLKQPGERVERDEPLVEIQTDKVNAEVPSPVAGILQQILLPEGTTAAVKTDMAIIGDEAPSPDAAEAEPETAPTAPESAPTAPETAPRAPESAPTEPESAPAAQGPEGTTSQRTSAEAAAASPPPLTFTYDTSAGGGVVGHRDEDPADVPAESPDNGAATDGE